MFLTKPPEPEPDEPAPASLTDAESHALGAFEDMGFHPFEAFSLVVKHISPSEVREFCRHHGCDPKTAVSILL